MLLWKILVSPLRSFSLFSFSSLVSSLVSSLYPSLYNLRDYNTAYLVAFVPGLKDATIAFDPELRTLVGTDRQPLDFDAFVKNAVENVVSGWDQGMRAPSETLPDVPMNLVDTKE